MFTSRFFKCLQFPVPDAGERISASLEDVSDTLRATAQSANSKISRAAEEQLAHQITAADSTLHRADSTLHSTVEDIASELPKNNTVLYISGKPVQRPISACEQRAHTDAPSLRHAHHAQDGEMSSLSASHGLGSIFKPML